MRFAMFVIHAYVLSHFSFVRLFGTPWTIVCHSTLPMVFSRQEYWSGMTFQPPGDLPGPGIKPKSLTSPEGSLMGSLAGASGFFTTSITWEVPVE